MAFESGFAANEFELQEKLNAFILSINGWTKLSQAGEFDSVYFSVGEDGYKDIYIRTVAGLAELPSIYAGNQRDFGDGYVGFLNFFAYQFFPEGGDGYDGYGEAGKIGPMLLWFKDEGNDTWEQAFSNQGSGSNNDRRWTRKLDITQQASDFSSIEFPSDPLSECFGTFDGKRRFWYTTDDDSISEWDFGSEGATMRDRRRESTVTTGMAYYVDPKTRKEYVWLIDRDTSSNMYDETSSEQLDNSARSYFLSRWNVEQGIREYGFAGPSWIQFNNVSNGSFDSQGGHVIWDGHDHLYVIRGEANSGYLITGSETSDWAIYTISTNTWTIYSTYTPPDTAPTDNTFFSSPTLPYTINDTDRVHLVWLDKNSSGFQYHRLYLNPTSSGNNVHYINIDENNGLPVGSWVDVGAQPGGNSTSASFMFHNNLDRFYFFRSEGTREMYYSKFQESGNQTWTLIDTSYTPQTTSQRNQFVYVDGYASRVRTSLYDNTKYWFFGSKDHICVVTKADDIYTFCYMGAITPFTSTRPAAKTLNPIFPGTNVQIQLDAIKGEFVIGQRMHISDVTETGGGSYIGDVEGVERKFMPTEKFQIVDVDPGVSITADQINNRYSVGSRVAFDPQPVGITLEGLDKIQMLNHINNFNSSGGDDMLLSTAKLTTVKDEVVNASGGDDRRNLYALWPVVILNSEFNDTSFSGVEARGSLVGVFATSGTGDLVDEDTISVGENTYIVLGVTSSKQFKYVFGPIN